MKIARFHRRTALTVPLLATGLLLSGLLSGCGTTDTVAARVGDTTVKTADVDLLAKVQCDLTKLSPQQTGAGAVSQRQLHDEVAEALIDSAIIKKALEGRRGDYDTSQFRTQLANLEQTLAKLPDLSKEERDQATDLLRDYVRGQLQMIRAGAETLSAKGVAKPTQTQISQAAQELYTKARKSLDVDIDPRYSPDGKGQVGREDGSMSVPVSAYAKQASKRQPDASWVAGLPASLRCGG